MTSEEFPAPAPVAGVDVLAPAQDDADDGQDAVNANEALFAHLKAHNTRLLKKDGRFVLSVAGDVDLHGDRIAFALVPPDGALMKAAKWKKLDGAARKKMVEQRINAATVEAMKQRVHAFVEQASALARELNLDSQRFWPALVTDGADEQARFATLLDRMRATHVKQQESLNEQKAKAAVNLKEYPDSFPAVALPRKLIALLGPTNSGKTHRAVEALKQASSGVYLAPLRLLANENYERLEAAGVAVSLITGEERKLHPNATHYASTVEMLDPHRPIDMAVIDEVQMLDDGERGGAWTAAICGVPAQTVYLLGSPSAEPALHALADRLGLPLSIEHLERKAPLEVERRPLGDLNALRPGDALIAFSRRDVLFLAQQLARMGRSVATIYGALSPESRRAQARRFESGEASIVVATDAIGMGLNLPISRVVFTTATKYDGYDEDYHPRALFHQIAGRAGRFGLHEAGRVCGLNEQTHWHLTKELRKAPAPLRSSRFQVSPSLDHLRALEAATGDHSLEKLLQRFVRNLDLQDDFFVPANLGEELARAPVLDRTQLSLEDRVMLSLVPLNTKVPALETAWREWVFVMAKGGTARFREGQPIERMELQEAEDLCRICAAYSWLSYRRPNTFPDGEHARELAVQLSLLIDEMLARRHGVRGKRAEVTKRARR
jgi:ATP-dependent RNA helicase SUPV3L1/SUV3